VSNDKYCDTAQLADAITAPSFRLEENKNLKRKPVHATGFAARAAGRRREAQWSMVCPNCEKAENGRK
jgi:hypothetical protein